MTKFVERRIERLIAKLKQSASIPLRLELWNGRTFDLASEPKVKIGVTSPAALRFLISPNLMKLGYAYVEGYPMPGFNVLVGLKVGI